MRAVVRAHASVRTECPPDPWCPDVDDEPFFRLLGEMITAGLARNGGKLAELTLNVSNVVVDEASAWECPAGEYVAVTISGEGDWSPETTWPKSHGTTPFVSPDFEAALRTARPSWAYTRTLASERGSVTVFFPSA